MHHHIRETLSGDLDEEVDITQEPMSEDEFREWYKLQPFLSTHTNVEIRSVSHHTTSYWVSVPEGVDPATTAAMAWIARGLDEIKSKNPRSKLNYIPIYYTTTPDGLFLTFMVVVVEHSRPWWRFW